MVSTKELNISTMEIHKMLRNNIMFAAGDKTIKSVLITSTKIGEGKTTIASNLAITIANSGKKTLLIDFNLINPSIHEFFDLGQAEQALSLFKTTNNQTEFIYQKNTENLYIITYQGLNKGNLSEIELCNKVKELLNDDTSQYDFIIIDAPPVTEASYVQIISQYVDGCIFVIGAGLSEMNEVKKAKELLEMAKANIIGAVLNNNTDNNVKNEYNQKRENPNISKKGVVTHLGKFFKLETKTKKRFVTTSLIISVLLSSIPILNTKVFNATASETVNNIANDEDIEIKISETKLDSETASTTESSIKSKSIFNDFMNYPKNFPMQLTVNKHYYFYVIGDPYRNYGLKIVGDNYENILTPYLSHWEWTPKTSGIFSLVTYDTDTNKVIGKSQKLYINSQNDQYLQFSDLDIEDATGTVNINAKLASDRPKLKNCLLSPELENKNIKLNINIGEPSIWNKTLLNKNLKLSEITSNYTLTEQKDMDVLGQGNYLITTSLKSENSIEFEDSIAKSYKKNNSESLNLSLKTESEENTYTLHEQIIFTASVDNKKAEPNLEYAFLLYDENGKRLVKSYSKDATFEWTPAKPGKYIIYARVKYRDKTSEYLPNCYEEEAYYQINVGSIEDNDIKINKVTVDYCLGDLENIETMKSHELHSLNIHASNGKCNPDLMYKAYSVHDGICETLCDYTTSNIIPFYPKSYGDYKLIICVKNSSSGSDDTQKTYDIKIK